MKMLIFFVALCFLLFCSAKHLCLTLKTAKDIKALVKHWQNYALHTETAVGKNKGGMHDMEYLG